jgi:hypothetical protein
MKPLVTKLKRAGTPGRIRTYDLLFRRQTLYPAELRVHTRSHNTILFWPLFMYCLLSNDTRLVHKPIEGSRTSL